MPYDIKEEEGVFAVYRLPYPGEKGGEEKVAEMDEEENAEMFVEFAQRKETCSPKKSATPKPKRLKKRRWKYEQDFCGARLPCNARSEDLLVV